MVDVILTLDERGRAALTVLEEICLATISEALSAPLTELIADFELQTRYQNGAAWAATTVDVLGRDELRVDIPHFNFRRSDEQIAFTFGGMVEGLYTAYTQSEDRGPEEVKGASYCDFEGEACWDLTRNTFDPDRGTITMGFGRFSTLGSTNR